MTLRFFSIFFFLTVVYQCKKDVSSVANISSSNNLLNTKFELLDSTQTHIPFINKVTSQENFNVLTYRNYYNGGGVAIGDINNDGLNDIYFTANMSGNKLYLNKGHFQFEDITEKAGVKGTHYWSTGVTMADVNADGYLDIYVCNSGDLEGKNRENELFINNGDLTFTESAKDYGLNDNGYSTHASFFDYDLDGDLDCYILNNSYKDPERIQLYSRERFKYGAPGGDRLFRNDGPSADHQTVKFTDVTKASGIYSSDIDFGLGISVGDVNGDHYPDMYISNDFWERDYLYLNQKDGTFKDVLTDHVSYVSGSSMGSDIGDLNNDGHADIFTTEMLPASNQRIKAATKFNEYFLEDFKLHSTYFHQFVQNCLQINRGDGTFNETAFYSGVAATDWSWGALFFDMDQDGKKDIFVSNGVYQDITDRDFTDFLADKEAVKKVVQNKGRYDFRDFEEFLPKNSQKNYAFINAGFSKAGGPVKFDNKASLLGLDQEGFSNGSAYGDLDNDGDYDLVVNNVNMPCFIYQNNTDHSKAKFLKLKLEGSAFNKKAIGTQVTIYHDGSLQTMEVMPARGFQSSVDPDLIFGLGDWDKIDSLVVVWPDLKKQILTNGLTANSTLTLRYTEGNIKWNASNYPSKQPFEKGSFLNPPFHQHENIYNDFDRDRLMPHMLSADNPKFVIGDVNGDKQDDLLVLDAMDSLPALYIHHGDRWDYSYQKSFVIAMTGTEVTAGAFADLDGDGDQDLVLGAGGNEIEKGFSSFALKTYTNDGKGNFNFELGRGPQINGFVGCIRPFDFNKDGKMDLFIGGKAVPGIYGLVPRSFLLRNGGGLMFADVTTDLTGPLGMVNDAVWTDLNRDGMTDLVIAGEWMPLTILYNYNGFLNKKYEIPNSSGWWNTLKAEDLDSDGRPDLVVGNWGLNMKFNASPERPMNMYTADFDKNGKPESIIEWFAPEDNISYPFASKQDITAQLPALKKTSLKYQEYAKKQIKDLFDPIILSKAQRKSVTNFKSSILWNKGVDNYVLEPLPIEAQLYPITAVFIHDIDHDGNKDLLLGGNFYKLKPEIGRMDSNWGGYFKGIGNGKFEFIDERKSGLFWRGEVKDIAVIDEKILVGINSGQTLGFRLISK